MVESLNRVAWEATVLPLNYTRAPTRILGSFQLARKSAARAGGSNRVRYQAILHACASRCGAGVCAGFAGRAARHGGAACWRHVGRWLLTAWTPALLLA
jgi:hypothetical protein